MITLNNCNIITEDDIHPVVECKGSVIINGESPHAKVRLNAPFYEGRRFKAFDRLVDATVTESNGSYTIFGCSLHLRRTVGARKTEAYITVLVTPDQPCVEALDEPEEDAVIVVEQTPVEDGDSFFVQFSESVLDEVEDEDNGSWKW